MSIVLYRIYVGNSSNFLTTQDHNNTRTTNPSYQPQSTNKTKQWTSRHDHSHAIIHLPITIGPSVVASVATVIGKKPPITAAAFSSVVISATHPLVALAIDIKPKNSFHSTSTLHCAQHRTSLPLKKLSVSYLTRTKPICGKNNQLVCYCANEWIDADIELNFHNGSYMYLYLTLHSLDAYSSICHATGISVLGCAPSTP